MKIKIYLLFLFVLHTASFAKYETMQEFKKNLKQQKHMSTAYVHESSDEFIINFKDINLMDTFELENRYSFRLVQCIADGICIFKYKGKSDRMKENIQKVLENETNVKEILEYKPYNFKAF